MIYHDYSKSSLSTFNAKNQWHRFVTTTGLPNNMPCEKTKIFFRFEFCHAWLLLTFPHSSVNEELPSSLLYATRYRLGCPCCRGGSGFPGICLSSLITAGGGVALCWLECTCCYSSCQVPKAVSSQLGRKHSSESKFLLGWLQTPRLYETLQICKFQSYPYCLQHQTGLIVKQKLVLCVYRSKFGNYKFWKRRLQSGKQNNSSCSGA